MVRSIFSYCFRKQEPLQENTPCKNFLYQYLATFTGTLVVICSGMNSAWPSPTLPLLLNGTSYIHITSSEGSWLAVMPCLGAPIGAVFSALLVDRIGRKYCVLLCTPLYLVAWFSIAFSTTLLLLLIARVLVGIADGILFTVFPIYVAEISHHSIRGILGTFVTVGFTLGTLIINILGIYCTIKTTALIAAVIPIVHFITFVWMPESPSFYIIKNKMLEADASLKKFTGSESGHHHLTPPSVNENRTSKLWSLVAEKTNRKPLGIAIGLRVVQQFSGNFVILFYCLLIFNEADGAISGSTATIIYFAIQLLSSIFSTLLVDISGRKPLLIISIIGSGITLATQGVYFYLKNETDTSLASWGFLPLAALVLYNILFNFGLCSLPTLILSELFSTHIKGVALCVCDIFFAATVVFSAKFFQIFKDEFGIHIPFFAFAGCCVVGLVFVQLCVPETKGKTLDEIQIEMTS